MSYFIRPSHRLIVLIVAALALSSLSGCAVIYPGQIGMAQRLGSLRPGIYKPGAYGFNPFLTTMVRVNVRTVEMYETLPLPTKEGLSVRAQITLLYHVAPKAARAIYTQFGPDYERIVVQSNFLATAREVSARYYAKELYAIGRKKVEQVIKDELITHISKHGFVVDAVLLKDILLPGSMSKAIQAKVNAEQAALKMDFVIQKQKKEAQRVLIEAQGIKHAQDVINSSLTAKLLQYNWIQALKKLVQSPNSKVIITNSKVPMLLNQD